MGGDLIWGQGMPDNWTLGFVARMDDLVQQQALSQHR